MKGQVAAITEFIASHHSHHIWVYRTIHTILMSQQPMLVQQQGRPQQTYMSTHAMADADTHATAHAETSFTENAATSSTVDATTSSTADAGNNATINTVTQLTADTATSPTPTYSTATAKCTNAEPKIKPHVITRNCNHLPQPHAHNANGPTLRSLSRHFF